MRIPTETPFVNASRGLVSSLQPWPRRSGDARPQPSAGKRFSIPRFDADGERLFWRERQTETLATLKSALLLGAIGFLAFIVLDITTTGLSAAYLIGRLPIVLVLCLLFVHLRHHPHPHTQIGLVAKLGAGASIANLSGTLLSDANPLFYAETWTGLLPIYFFTYGQLFMTIAETVLFGWLAMLALPLSGYLIGVEPTALIPSILILLIVNLFGICTRCQLESHSRRAFQARRKAETAAEDKTLFLRQLSHNLRQPLQALSCYSSVLGTAYAQKNHDPLHSVVDKMGTAIDELNNAFTHILDIANLETGKQIPLLAAVDINLMLAVLEDQFAPQAAKRGLKLKVRLRNRPPYSVHSDAAMLRQIVGNLIDNALKYTLSGWIVVAAVNIGGGRLKLHVRDSGIGIPEALRDDIFKEFVRCHKRQTDTQAHGLGIGLAYALTASERLPNHNLRVFSRQQQGSDFQLCLPTIGNMPQHFRIQAPQPDFGGSFVFIVDDDRQVLNAMAEQLTGWGCRVEKAGSLPEIQTALADNLIAPDLLITDFYLDNRETAHDIIAAVQADCGPVPVLILSARAIPDTEKAKWPKNTLLLRKPASSATLMATMLRAIKK